MWRWTAVGVRRPQVRRSYVRTWYARLYRFTSGGASLLATFESQLRLRARLTLAAETKSQGI